MESYVTWQVGFHRSGRSMELLIKWAVALLSQPSPQGGSCKAQVFNLPASWGGMSLHLHGECSHHAVILDIPQNFLLELFYLARNS